MDRRLPFAGFVLLSLGLLLWAAHPVDLAIHHVALLDRRSWAVRQALWFTSLGGLLVMGPVALLAAGGLFWRRRGGEALWLVLTIMSGRLLVEGVKLLVQRPRPPIADRLEWVTSWSFPSSHSAGTMMTCVALSMLWGRTAGWIAALFAAVAIGWSRVALGVHWPSDVLAGWGFGLLWVGAAVRWAPQKSPLPPSQERVG
ncbi:phosphatase PAP2 family protein [Sphingomonas sp. CGMCC 1.13654]|uniref:Phosphatase PAP2 family protein n=1 Tax=Sphingomonas chungangi TaxID=2683589 RepID=A0A838LCW6_9SPHN|nr:phosphatase PAP2 family protein [Sphingomonas chungangi]MBA2935338.1 phosphatase PAP2 family protein [Sphingomonas chungangi]